MKTVGLIRGPSTDEGTFSTLKFGDVEIRAIELPWRGNRPQVSCIPLGEYRCEIRYSPKHKMDVYGLQHVPGRSDIEIHPANFAGDVEKFMKAELLGCIAPCMLTGYLQNDHGKPQRAGLSSKPAVAMLMAWADNEPLTLSITQEPEA